MDRLQELVRLHRLGTGAREVARLLGMSPNTERTYREALEARGVLAGAAEELPPLELLKAVVREELGTTAPPAQTVSSLANWKPEIEVMLGRGAGPRAIYDALKLKPEFPGSLSAIKRMCRRLVRERGISPEDVAIPVETPPGQIAQVDFGYVGRLVDPATGLPRKAWVFVMVLGFSRHMYAAIVFDQRVETWMDLHMRAFQVLGGVPAVVVPDNLKAAVVRAAFSPSDVLEINRSYRELARAYGFKIDPTPPRAPKKKGKVESAVKYIKHNFIRPREFRDIDQANAELEVWVREVAGRRTHGTTGRQPLEAFQSEERATLRALPARPYEITVWKKAQVYRDSHIIFGKRLYSVPWRLIGSTVWVKATPATVVIYAQDERVATHERRGNKKRSTIEAHLPEHRRDYRERERRYWEERAGKLGEEVAAFIRAVFDADDVLYQLRTVQAMVRHLETFPRTRARAAATRAHHFDAFTYRALKDILRKGLDLEPLPGNAPAAAVASQSFRFARRPSELVQHKLELTVSSEGDSNEYN